MKQKEGGQERGTEPSYLFNQFPPLNLVPLLISKRDASMAQSSLSLEVYEKKPGDT